MTNIYPASKINLRRSQIGIMIFALTLSSSLFSQGITNANIVSLNKEVSQVSNNTQAFLPVTLVQWNVVLNNNDVVLNWTTTTEKNSSRFLVERSFNGINFSEIANLSAAGNSEITRKYK